MVDLVNFGGPQFNPNARGNQQGTLFSNQRLNAANRTGDEVGHKGFSQNRLAEVRDRVNVQFSGRLSHTRRSSDVTWNDDNKFRGNPNQHVNDVREGVAERLSTIDVHETIARSTMPMDDLRHLTQNPWGRDDPFPQNVRLDSSKPEGAGAYNPVSGDVSLDSRVPPETLLHELGHAVDFKRYAGQDPSTRTKAIPGVQSGGAALNRVATSDQSEIGVASARTEGFADAYADRHALNRDGSTPRNLSIYEQLPEKYWSKYAGETGSSTVTEDVRSTAYREARRFHGGRNLSPEPPRPEQGQLF
jgi:hypothetical protein